MTDDNCIFCKIAGGVIPSATLYEDEDFRVILDLGPASRGHALILPKQHFADVCSLDGDIAAKVLPLGAKIGSAMKKSLGCAGFNLVQNNGEAAGQTVFQPLSVGLRERLRQRNWQRLRIKSKAVCNCNED